MAVVTVAILTRDISAELQADIAKFDRMLEAYLEGRLDEDVFRVVRLNNGVYGQRQGGRNQMVRIKAPYGSITPEQLEALAEIADTYSRGWGHLTTRQNIQFHFVELERVPRLLRDLARVGLTTREACGDTVRNITGCHLAGACPFEVLDISPWAEAAFRHFLHHPYAQRLPRKFKINFSGCMTDCGQAMFNDIGVVAVARPLPDGTTEAGFRVFIAGGLGANPHPAKALEEFTPREQLLATLEAVLRTFDHYGNRDNKLRARLKWLVDTMGIDELRERVLKERKLLLASSSWPGGIPAVVAGARRRPGGRGRRRFSHPRGHAGDPSAGARRPLQALGVGQRRDRGGQGHGFRHGLRPPGRRHLGPVPGAGRGPARPGRHHQGHQPPEPGVPGPDRRPAARALPPAGDDRHGRARRRTGPGRGLLPGRRHLQPRRHPEPGPGRRHRQSPGEAPGLADVGGVRVNISGCTNSCGQHHTADIGFHGVERRAHGRPAPGYQLLLGGHIGKTEIEFGQRALRLPAKACAEATVRIVGRFADERQAGEDFSAWLERSGGAKALAADLADLDNWPSPEERPDFYIDFDETGPYVAEVGMGECAGA